MKRISTDNRANILFEMNWQSAQGTHMERYAALGVNLWKDFIPEALAAELEGKRPGEEIVMNFDRGTLIPGYDPLKSFFINKRQFNKKEITPQMGRFYPKGILSGVNGVFPQNVQPFRVVDVQKDRLRVDFNHPLAKTEFQLRAVVEEIMAGSGESGGRCNDWVGVLSDGPGMQVPWGVKPTAFFEAGAFSRKDEKKDAFFYETPRMVQHIDSAASHAIGALYRQSLKKGMRVLDLMSSWQSHLPSDLALSELIGLGLNPEELKKNSALQDWVVHDLNEDPALPFAPEDFDAVICSVSIEYLVRPEAVFKEIARVLRPDGSLIITFSNRWFPTKAIQIWEALHEFERMGLVLAYFQKTGSFYDIETFSLRGLPRPVDDKYFPEIRYSDPVYAVSGKKRNPVS
jgi:SAM-dependent methyltransferase